MSVVPIHPHALAAAMDDPAAAGLDPEAYALATRREEKPVHLFADEPSGLSTWLPERWAIGACILICVVGNIALWRI